MVSNEMVNVNIRKYITQPIFDINYYHEIAIINEINQWTF